MDPAGFHKYRTTWELWLSHFRGSGDAGIAPKFSVKLEDNPIHPRIHTEAGY